LKSYKKKVGHLPLQIPHNNYAIDGVYTNIFPIAAAIGWSERYIWVNCS
jgi:hypothetical protein